MKRLLLGLAVLASLLGPAKAVDKTIDQLNTAGTITGSESIPIFQLANPAVRATPDLIFTYYASKFSGAFTCNASGVCTIPAGSIAASKLIGTDITTVGTLTAGGTGAGFVLALGTSTVTGTLPTAAVPAFTGDMSNSAGSLTMLLNTVNSNVGSFGSATSCNSITVNAKGLITAASTATCTPAFTSITGQATLAQFPTIAANTVISNWTSGSSVPSANVWPACSNDGAHALVYVNGTGLQCVAISVGTGTISSVVCNGLTITATGACPSAPAIYNCSLSTGVGSNILTVALKDAAGSDPSATSPCVISFRNATATDGTVTQVARTSALSITTHATGASLGCVNSVACRLWVVVFNDGGTPVMALINASSHTVASTAIIYPLDETQVASSTAMSSGATSAGVFYTPNGTTVTSKAFRVVGYVEYNSSGLATAGTYASAPNYVQFAYPNLKRPGDIVACRTMQSASGTSTTSSTYTATNASIAISPTSAANLIQYHAFGTLNTAVSVNTVWARVQRGSTAVTGATRNYTSAGGDTYVPWAQSGWDKPNSTSSTTYAVYIASNNNTNTAQLLDGQGISACEVMG